MKARLDSSGALAHFTHVKAFFPCLLLFCLSSACSLAAPKLYYGPEIARIGYGNSIFSLEWDKDKKIHGQVKPLTGVIAPVYLFEGDNSHEGKMTFVISDTDKNIVARGSADNNSFDDRISWNGKIIYTERDRFALEENQPNEVEFDLWRPKDRNLTEVEQMIAPCDGPVGIGCIDSYVLKGQIGALKALLAASPAFEKPQFTSKKGLEKLWTAQTPRKEFDAYVRIEMIGGDPWKELVRLRQSGLVVLAAMHVDPAGGSAEDIIEVSAEKVSDNGVVSPAKVKELFLGGLQNLASKHKSDWVPEIRAIKVNGFSGSIKVQGALADLADVKAKALCVADYAFTVTKLPETPNGKMAIVINYIEAKWSDPPVLGSNFPPDKYFKNDVAAEHYERISGVFARSLGTAGSGKVIFSAESPFSSKGPQSR